MFALVQKNGGLRLIGAGAFVLGLFGSAADIFIPGRPILSVQIALFMAAMGVAIVGALLAYDACA